MTFIDWLLGFFRIHRVGGAAWRIWPARANRAERRGTLWRRLRKLVAQRTHDLRWFFLRGEDSDRPSLSAEREAEVFPWMEHAIVAGALLGAVVAFGLGRACHVELSVLILGGFLGTAAGALGGFCLALKWAVEVPAHPAAPRALWDPWLDARAPQHDDVPEPTSPIEGAAGETGGEIGRRGARVRPRVLSPETGSSLPLADMIGPILTGPDFGVVRLVGPPGSGKTIALEYLAGLVPPYLSVSFLDDPRPSAVVKALTRGWVVSTSDKASRSLPSALATNLRLAPWGEDEWIEYLLAGDRRTCASVMARLANSKIEAARLDGIPELWRPVLDRMMADPSVPGPLCALRNELAALLSDADYRPLIQADCFVAVAVNQGNRVGARASILRHDPEQRLLRLIRHRLVQILLAADGIAGAIKNEDERETLAVALPRDLVLETASRIADDSQAVERLRTLMTGHDRSLHPMVASLLHALGIGWKPNLPPPRLAGAYLENASWPDIDLTRADTQGVDLGGANLSGSRFDRANLVGAHLGGANLCDAALEGAKLEKADLSRACLTQVRAEGACLQSAQLVGANLVKANLDWGNLVGADLTDARLADASLVRADLRSAKLEGADFSRANFEGAILEKLRLAGAEFTGARFMHADLSGCDLEGMRLPGATFADANLRNALLTGSRMPGADFRGACLQAAGLAEVDWEGADLRGADLSEAAFHLGSARSGLVGSPIACEGTRTGFYTDDFDEQAFKSPEEIRKANLRGTDLRGAIVDKVDFYLVDLRGARLDPEQVPHIRRSGAILEARA
jgi:uncharacterized protein YjbI with pentapeptide repeats